MVLVDTSANLVQGRKKLSLRWRRLKVYGDYSTMVSTSVCGTEYLGSIPSSYPKNRSVTGKDYRAALEAGICWFESNLSDQK